MCIVTAMSETADTHAPDNVSVFEVLKKGLQDLADMCDVVEEKFTTARDDYMAQNPDGVHDK